MAQIPSTASYKRREIKGQLLMDFGEDLASSFPSRTPLPSPAPRAPSRPSTSTVAKVPAPSFDYPSEIQALAALSENDESASAKLDGAPNYKLTGRREGDRFPDYPNEINQLAASLEPKIPTHFVTDARATELIEQAAREVRPGEVRAVRVRFLPFRATLYSFKMDRTRTAAVKFHVAFRRASDAVILQAARLMLCRVRKIRHTLPRSEYDTFVRSLPPTEFKLPGARQARKMSYGAQGMCRHLEESFRRINEAYFSSQLKQPELCWSPVRARRILGSYQERCDRLIVSRVFDSPSVPLFVLDFLMYHELLHKFLGVGRRGDGRRCMHGPEFKELERKFSRFEEAQEFIKRL
jgi:hypothetical protein